VDKTVWVEAFVRAISRLGVRGEPHFIADMGEQLYDTQGHLAPEKVAQSQWDEWLPSGPAPL
jgi:hypothetical protein